MAYNESCVLIGEEMMGDSSACSYEDLDDDVAK